MRCNVKSRPVFALALAAASCLGVRNAQPAGAAGGLHVVATNGTGQVLETSGGSAGSPSDTFRSGLSQARARFGTSLHVLGAVRSNDQTLTLAFFKARDGGAAVGGYVLTTFVPHGSSRVDILFDRVDRVGETLSPMLTRLTSMHAAAATPGAIPELQHVTSPDASVHAMIPAGWKTPVFAQGAFAAIGPHQEEVDQEVSIPLSDPRGELRNGPGLPLTYSPDVAQDYIAVTSALAQRGIIHPVRISISHVKDEGSPFAGARVAELTGTSVRDGITFRFDGLVLASQPNQFGGWNVGIKMVAAPAAEYARDLPTLMAIYNSYNVDQGVRGQQVAQTLQDDREGAARGQAMMAATQARNTAVFNASMGHARAVQDGIDRSTSGFVHYLNGTTVVENTSTGARGSAGENFAQNIVDANPQNFRIVPVNEYRAGD